ncbi:hypothetical protein CSUI_008273, partial [Cystoisospora suis]
MLFSPQALGCFSSFLSISKEVLLLSPCFFSSLLSL